MLQPGARVDRYVVEGLLGEGGMAVVYCVRHRTLGTRHALKLLAFTGGDVQARLVQEGRVQAQLNHPNVVSVSDVIEHNGMPGLVMEYVEGPPLDLWLDHYQPTVDEALAVFRGIVVGVGAAHAQGLVHRDLKPGNVLLQLDENGAVPRVTDFGLVKMRRGGRNQTRSGSTMGTPLYMAPEQIRDASTVDRRADIYSLGVMLYELVCGRPPYRSDDLIEIFNLAVNEKREHPSSFAPGVPEHVVDAIDAMLAVNPDNRVADCAGVLALLDGVAPGDITLSTTYEHEEALPEPTPMPEPEWRMSLEASSAGIIAARGLARVIRRSPTNPSTDPPAPPVVASTSSRLPWFLVLLLVGVLCIGGLASASMLVAAYWPSPVDTVPVRVPIPVVAPATPVSRAVPAPPPEPEPEPLRKPEPPARPAPVERPVPAAPAPVEPPPEPVIEALPVPVVPAPEPVVEPEPAGTFRVDKDPGTVSVVLTGEAGTFSPGEAIPPGRYTVRVGFHDHAPFDLSGQLVIQASKTVTLKCRSGNTNCIW